MAFLCVLSFLTYYDRQCITRAADAIGTAFKLSKEDLGWALGSFWLAYALFEIPGGWLCDRYGGRRALTRIVIAWSIFTAMTGMATGMWTLFLYRFLFGMGEAGAYPSMARVQSTWLSPRARARAGGLLWLTARWGAAFAPLIFGAILRFFDWGPIRSALAAIGMGDVAGWRLGFFVSGLFGVVWVVFFWRFFRDDPARHPKVNAAELTQIRTSQGQQTGATQATAHHSGAALLQIFKSPSLWAIAVLYLCASFGFSFFMSWMPEYHKQVHGLAYSRSEWESAMPLLFSGLACLVGGIGSDALVKRMASKRLARAIIPVCGYLTAAFCMVAIRWVETPAQATALLCVTAFTFDLGQGANWASIVDIGGRHAGMATGFINSIGNLSHFIQPRIGAWVFGTFGWGPLFLVYAAAFCGAALMWLFIDPTKRFYKDPEEVRGFEVLPPKA
ncbi:MAG: MFS transporter [Phycisphaerae bacterium]